MNPQKELQQMQDLSLKLDIPIWKNSIELPFRDKKKYHTFAIEKKFFFTWSEDNGSEDNQKIIIFISTQTNLIEVLQYSTFLGKQHEFYLTSSQLIRERIHQFEVPESASQNNFVSFFLTELLETASQKKATDIHFSPTPQDNYNIQIRIEGKLQIYKNEVLKGVLLKIKLLSQMDVAKTRFPQDGYMNFQDKKGKKFDVRVATIPSVLGEKMVIRILPLENLEIDFKKLNFPKPFIAVVEKLITDNISGWIFLTNPQKEVSYYLTSYLKNNNLYYYSIGELNKFFFLKHFSLRRLLDLELETPFWMQKTIEYSSLFFNPRVEISRKNRIFLISSYNRIQCCSSD